MGRLTYPPSSAARSLLLALGLAIGFGTLAARPSAAISLTPDPLIFDLPGLNLSGSIDFVGMETGLPTGGSVLGGAVGATDVSLLFTLSVDAGSGPITNLDLFNLTDLALAVGTIAGSGVDIASGSLSLPSVSFAGAGVQAGETSDVLFVSYGSATPGATLSLSSFAGLVNYGAMTVVPEPATGTLLALGLLALVVRRRG